MARDNQCREPKLYQDRIVEGAPIEAAGWELTPLARVVTFGKASSTVSAARIGGWGAGFARIAPVAVLVDSGDGQERIEISDPTAQALVGILAAAISVVAFTTAVRLLARRLRQMRA